MNFTKYNPENRIRWALLLTAGLLLIAASPAFAHHPMGGMTPETFGQGLLSGFGHPIIGPDHFAFLIVAMLLTAALKGTARYIVPLAFIGATIAGTVIHLGAANIPMAESLIALSVIIGAVLVITRSYPGALVLAAIFAGSGILHGYAYGEAIIGAEATPLMSYLFGFAFIQYAIIVGGVIGLERLTSRSEKLRTIMARTGSVLALLTGGLFLAQSLT